jgi:type II secretory pathway component PulL
MNRSIALLAVAVFFAPALAEASAQGTQVIKNWKSSDKCSQQAQTAFPDFTPESNAKRDAQLKACLEGQRLAPRAPNGPSQ